MGGPAGSSGWEGAALPRGLFGLGTEHVLSRVTLGCPISLAGCSVYWGPRWEPTPSFSWDWLWLDPSCPQQSLPWTSGTAVRGVPFL